MMDTQTATPKTNGHPCNCRCEECSSQCCELECLIQPRFYCGQLLTDQDLTVLLDWVKAKTGLARYRHGWGVVCGLEVQCQTMPGSEMLLKVTPGYAIDCCGNDIVVCADATLDLSPCCKPKPQPCLETAPSPQQTPVTKVKFGPWELPSSDVQAVDVVIRYAESQTDSRPGLARGGCGGTIACEYTRTHESYTLDCRLVDDCADPTSKVWQEWYRGYQVGLKKLLDSLASLNEQKDPQAKLDRVIAWLRQNPLYSFCFVGEWLSDLQGKPQLPTNWFDDVIFWIVQDWRNHYLICNCVGCGPDTAVPLARVWLWRRKDNRGKDRCTPIYTIGYPPFRRPVSRECWPAAAGQVSLAPHIWQLQDSTCLALQELGFGQISFQQFQYTDLTSLRGTLDSEVVYLSCTDASDTSLVAYFCADHCGEKRIVYFGRRKTESERSAEPSGTTAGSAAAGAVTGGGTARRPR
jgi:hypothetical protein